MHTPRRVPPGRTEGSVRRPRPAPLSPKPQWKNLFLEPRYPDADADKESSEDADDHPHRAAPEAHRSRRPHRG
ncbi:hypothetical protein [Streptomyces nigrescens]|uniref:hypothetical protein n=1 Tax=Streptomyces nigrescens TaxID=1920 RepID=UPI0036F89AC8